METVWLKTEPDDGTLNVNDQPLTIISQDSPNNSCNETDNDDEDIDLVRDATAEKAVKHRKRKVEKVPNAKSDGKKVEKKSRDKKLKQSLVCDVCDRKFTCAGNLRRHKLSHSNAKPFVCPEDNCGAAFRRNEALKAHQMTHTGERKPERRFFCEACGLGFLSKFYMQFHYRAKHSGERPYVCGECGQGFAQKRCLNKHVLEHSGNRPFECDECGLRFFRKVLLKSHKKTHDGRPFSCTECGKGFYHKTSLNAHQRNHLTVRPFGCDICGKRFIQKGSLNVHKVIHSDVRFSCEECGLRFTQQYTLKTHRMKEHGLSTDPPKQQRRRVQSSVVSVTSAEPKTVPDNDNVLVSGCDNVQPLEPLKINAIDPTPKSIHPLNTIDLNRVTKVEARTPIKIERNSPSSDSDYSEHGLETNGDESIEFDDKSAVDHSIDALQLPFIDSTELNQIKEESTEFCETSLTICKSEPTTPDDDYVSETEKSIVPVKNPCDKSTERPFSCDECERKFAQIGSLKTHQRAHERAKKEKPPCVCDVCGKIYSDKKNLQIHQRIHSGSTPYCCKECGRRFNSRANMITHQLTHTGVRRFECDTCGAKFAKKDTMEMHRFKHIEEKNFECDICGNKFKNPVSLRRHKLSHRTDKMYACDMCDKSFYVKSFMVDHLRTHTGDKPFACDQCSYRSNVKAQVNRHKKHTHREMGEPSEYQKRKLRKMMKTKEQTVDNTL